ncbi:MAG: hypothetical protein FDW93_06160 [Bergeyella sp.]|nr:hypothetical protein [Bergeyella sp.]
MIYLKGFLSKERGTIGTDEVHPYLPWQRKGKIKNETGRTSNVIYKKDLPEKQVPEGDLT